jgi:hypothetical protein
MDAILSPLRVPLLALGIGLGGVGLAWLWFNDKEIEASVAVLVAFGLGFLLDLAGKGRLPDHPVSALWLLEGYALVPIAIATAAAAAVVIVTVELTLPDTTPTETKELVGAASTGVTTFLTAGFISAAGDENDSTLADHIKDAFQGKYSRPGGPQGTHAFRPESPGEFWVFAEHYRGVSGWGQPARLKRAKGVATELRTGDSNP